MPNTNQLLRLVGGLYDAASDPSLWGSFLEDLVHTLRADSVVLLMHDTEHYLHRITNNFGLDPENRRDYDRHYCQVDFWVKKSLSVTKPGWVATSEELSSFDELSGSEFYNDFLKRWTTRYGLFGVMEKDKQRQAGIAVLRRSRAKSFGQSEQQTLRYLIPHMRRVFRLHFQLSEMRSRNSVLETALDAMPTGIILLGHCGQIIEANKLARKTLNQKDGLSATPTGLCAASSMEAVVLQQLIASAEATSTGKGIDPAGATRISRSKGPPLEVVVTPVRHLSLDLERPVTAIVFVSDPAHHVRPAGHVLQSLFDLTPAESRVALLLADGTGPQEIAEMLGVTSNTVKTQIASVYAKTGVSRQSQLVRLVLTLPSQPSP